MSDLLKLRIGDFVDARGNMRDSFTIREAKRGKRNEVVLNDSIQEALVEFLGAYPTITSNPNHFVFFNTKTNDYSQPIGRKQAWKLITTICQEVGLRGNFGTHSLRKTWGYHARMSGVDLTLIMEKLNHNSLAYTKRYLGVTDDELADVVRRVNL